PGPEFTGSADDTHTLTVSRASTTTTADNVTTLFSVNGQVVTLTANVASSAGPVNEGTVTFTVPEVSSLFVTGVTSTVSDGRASVRYALPAGLAAGSYAIDAVYN